MGQKIDPRALRLGVINNWDSRWFFSQKGLYRKTLVSDVTLRDALMKKLSSNSVTKVELERTIKKITIIIYAVKPGLIIGRGGKSLEELKKFVHTKLQGVNTKDDLKIDLKIEPVNKPFLDAYYVAQTISQKLVKGMPHRSVVHMAMNKVMESGGRGVKIQLGGRIAGAEISRREKYYEGTVPTSTIRENIDYSECPALTKSGYVGVKVWICK